MRRPQLHLQWAQLTAPYGASREGGGTRGQLHKAMTTMEAPSGSGFGFSLHVQLIGCIPAQKRGQVAYEENASAVTLEVT